MKLSVIDGDSLIVLFVYAALVAYEIVAEDSYHAWRGGVTDTPYGRAYFIPYVSRELQI